ncbi:hypothetical protein RvY_01712 [Ramazzottius varieornatus]|uniref:Uncharacterized protein n=1 Tax=Ramazzottius varieornatus TaxID=947166 RepID=A0A1D1UHC8_RAMVA|nr:hypothetical protein RvY_01712 [Ramazzottius varieornatus]
MKEDGRRTTTKTSTRPARRIKLPSVLPDSEGDPKLAEKTLATDSKDPTTRGPARASNRERRSQSDM